MAWIELTRKEVIIMEHLEPYCKKLKEDNCCYQTKVKYFNLIKEMLNRYPNLTTFIKINEKERFYKNKVRFFELWSFYYTLTKEYSGICAYIVELEDKNQIKVGKAKNFDRRKRELENQYGTVNTIHLFKFDDEEDAYMMEVLLHRFFKQYYPNSRFIPQDRFENADYTLTELEMLDRVAEELRNKKWF